MIEHKAGRLGAVAATAIGGFADGDGEEGAAVAMVDPLEARVADRLPGGAIVDGEEVAIGRGGESVVLALLLL